MIKDTRIVKDAVFLVDDNTLKSGKKGLSNVQSGWDFDDRSHVVNPAINTFHIGTNDSSEYDAWIRRKIIPQKTGNVGHHLGLKIHSGKDFYLRYYGETEDKVFEISEKDGFFAVDGKKLPLPIDCNIYDIDITFRLDQKLAELYINEIGYGEFPICFDSFEHIKIGVVHGKSTCITPTNCRVWINYLVLDKCLFSINGPVSDKWKFLHTGDARLTKGLGAERYGSVPAYCIYTADSQKASVTRHFDEAKGVVCFELKYHSFADNINAGFSLMSKDKSIITLTDNGNALYNGDKILRKHHVNVWQTLYIEAHLDEGFAVVMLNGKKCDKVALPQITTADGISISFAKDDGGALEFAHIYAYMKQPEPDDYVPAPVLPKKNDYRVGMNICSLWRNGDHWGWDTITPFEENKTYLGYYDEGLAEVADWEIKWLSEHGVDFELYCWYNNQFNAPIMRTGLSVAIHDGHFKAKYGDLMKFAIIWEAANCVHAGIEGFRNHIVPYWMDYFFSDSRYYTIDNKVLISVFGSGQLIKDFGSEEAVKEQLDYVREEVKKLGYDGAIFMSCSDASQSVKNCGFDAIYAYNWGTQGYDPEYTLDNIKRQMKADILHVIPTVSTGFNSIGWNKPRTPLMTTSDMDYVLNTFKKELLPKNDGEEWKRKFIMLSTWNEYGEGTYMCPANHCGFDYLDVVRNAVTSEQEPHTDIRPTEKQLDRLGYLYPKGRRWVKCEGYEPKPVPSNYVDSVSLDSENWSSVNLDEIHNDEQNRLCGSGKVFDPQIFYTKPIKFNAIDVDNIVVKMKVGLLTGSRTNANIYFITEEDPVWSWEKCVECKIKANEFYEHNFLTKDIPTWKGTIIGLRIDPTSDAGNFEIEKITLCADKVTPVIFVNGEKQLTSVPPIIKDNEIYIPYEQNKSYKTLKFYHEWYYDEKTLYLVHGDKQMYFTEGKDYAIVDGKKRPLCEPFFRYDSVPMLPLSMLCEECGFKATLDGIEIKIEG